MNIIKRFIAYATLPLLTLGGATVAFADYNSDWSSNNNGSGNSYEANLSGDNEVPPVDTDAWGNLSIGFDSDSADINAEGEGLKDVLGAHIHCGWEGENGPIIVDLLDASGDAIDEDLDTEKYHTISFSIQDEDVKDNADCKDRDISNLEDLSAAAEDGYLYVNVHTKKNPNGEIRGQLEENGDNGDRNDDHSNWSDNDNKEHKKSNDHSDNDWNKNDDEDWENSHDDSWKDEEHNNAWNDHESDTGEKDEHEDREDDDAWEHDEEWQGDINRWSNQHASRSDDRSWESNHDNDTNDWEDTDSNNDRNRSY